MNRELITMEEIDSLSLLGYDKLFLLVAKHDAVLLDLLEHIMDMHYQLAQAQRIRNKQITVEEAVAKYNLIHPGWADKYNVG